MIPFTPTPMPPGQPVVQITYSLWNSTSAAITSWQWAGGVGLLLQVIILVVLIIVGVTVLRRQLQQISTEPE